MSADEIWDYIVRLHTDKFLAQIAQPSPLMNFEPSKNWNWFERTFCKHIIEHINYIERRLPSKKVKWNRYK